MFILFSIPVYNIINYRFQPSQTLFINVEKGQPLQKTHKILSNSGLETTYPIFRLYGYLFNHLNKLKFGYYEFSQDSSYSINDIYTILCSGISRSIKITIHEGTKFRDIAKQLEEKLKLDKDTLNSLFQDTQFLRSLDITSTTLEGFLYPETYQVPEYYMERDVIKLLVNTFHKNIEPLKPEIEKSKFTLNELLTLASIIQGECMVIDEAEMISAVYNNRLDNKMLLQADPTIQYLFKNPKRLLFKDLEIDSPYNTYKYKGLPPTPINNPSITMIKAALNPSKSSVIYMVADGTGRHNFNTNLKDHLEDKKILDEIRRNHK